MVQVQPHGVGETTPCNYITWYYDAPNIYQYSIGTW